MVRRMNRLATPLLLACLPWSPVFAQFGGSRAGLEDHPSGIANLPHLDRETVEGFIAIDGRAEIRVRPTEIRVVLAVNRRIASHDTQATRAPFRTADSLLRDDPGCQSTAEPNFPQAVAGSPGIRAPART